jgi:Cof subfamily protein (haloacid dehalogenase superfamily)
LRYKLLALDVDGTLLTSRGTISPATQAALVRARARGLLITLATGRRLATVRQQVEELGIQSPLILQSGAQIVDPRGGEALYSNPLPPGQAAAAVRIAVEEGVQPILYEDRAVAQHMLIGPREWDSAPMGPYVAARPALVRRLPYDELAATGEALQLAVIDRLPVVRRVAARLQLAHCRTLVSYSATLDAYFLEVFHEKCSKGEALRHLASSLGIPLGQVVAVGDNYNDEEMLRVAGLGVAVANAEPEILAVADKIVPSNDEDGIAALVDELLTSGD